MTIPSCKSILISCGCIPMLNFILFVMGHFDWPFKKIMILWYSQNINIESMVMLFQGTSQMHIIMTGIIQCICDYMRVNLNGPSSNTLSFSRKYFSEKIIFFITKNTFFLNLYYFSRKIWSYGGDHIFGGIKTQWKRYFSCPYIIHAS